MKSKNINEKLACFISSDGEVATIIHEDDGEVMRIEGENLTFED